MRNEKNVLPLPKQILNNIYSGTMDNKIISMQLEFAADNTRTKQECSEYTEDIDDCGPCGDLLNTYWYDGNTPLNDGIAHSNTVHKNYIILISFTKIINVYFDVSYKLIKVILFFCLFIINIFCFGQNAVTKYKLEDDGLSIEIPEDTLANRYTIDNEIYKGNNKYLITYKYIKNDSLKLFRYVNTGKWDFISEDSINSKKVISFLELNISPDDKSFMEYDSGYDQTIISYSYFSNYNTLNPQNYFTHQKFLYNFKFSGLFLNFYVNL